MGLSLSSIVKNVWNVFSNRSPTGEYKDIGSGYSYRPDRFRLTRGNERSIVTSVYNRIALDEPPSTFSMSSWMMKGGF